MTRTGQQWARRARIADAAAGVLPSALGSGVPRVRVVIYTCTPPGSPNSSTLDALRRYADARDWTIVAEVVDQADPLTPPADRPLWPTVREHIESRQAEGIVTDVAPGDVDLENAWLTVFHAFAARVTTESDETPAAAADTATGSCHRCQGAST